MKKNTLLLAPDSAAGQPATPAAPLTTDTAAAHLADLKAAVTAASTLAAALLRDPHFAKCPFVAAICSGVDNGALNRLKHLEQWLTANPVPAAPAAVPDATAAPAAA